MHGVSISTIALHFRGRRFANLILAHAESTDLARASNTFAELMGELPDDIQKPTEALIDFVCEISQQDARRLFIGDCGEKFKELAKVTRGFLGERYGLSITDVVAFQIFNLLVQHFAIACLRYPDTMSAMRMADGQGRQVARRPNKLPWSIEPRAFLLRYMAGWWAGKRT